MRVSGGRSPASWTTAQALPAKGRSAKASTQSRRRLIRPPRRRPRRSSRPGPTRPPRRSPRPGLGGARAEMTLLLQRLGDLLGHVLLVVLGEHLLGLENAADQPALGDDALPFAEQVRQDARELDALFRRAV